MALPRSHRSAFQSAKNKENRDLVSQNPQNFLACGAASRSRSFPTFFEVLCSRRDRHVAALRRRTIPSLPRRLPSERRLDHTPPLTRAGQPYPTHQKTEILCEREPLVPFKKNVLREEEKKEDWVCAHAIATTRLTEAPRHVFATKPVTYIRKSSHTVRYGSSVHWALAPFTRLAAVVGRSVRHSPGDSLFRENKQFRDGVTWQAPLSEDTAPVSSFILYFDCELCEPNLHSYT